MGQLPQFIGDLVAKMDPGDVSEPVRTPTGFHLVRLDGTRGGEDFEALASVTSEDPGSASRGGDLGWTSPGTFDPAFEEALAALEQDQISEPFRTQFGWHIVQLLGRRTHDQSDELRRQRVLTALRESKVDEETELWLRRLRDEAYVEIRNP
jgi:peptidyl-prolyl cis-trans isomerase SurA